MTMSLDTDVLIIGAGMSGLGIAVQLVRKFGHRNFELIEKSNDVGGTWLANKYPGCGCDVASHFYSYSFALNPNWSQKYSMREEIQTYFRSIAEQYQIVPHIRFHSTVETALWDKTTATWLVTVKNQKTKEIRQRRCKILVSAVGALSVPKECEVAGAESFKGSLFHSAKWDHAFDWEDKEVVVLGNGCSATQFVPIMSADPSAVRKITQFSRQAQYLGERENPYYSSSFKFVMRYLPFAMRLYRFKIYADMEKDFAGFDIEGGKTTRDDLVKENKEYVMKTAPERYWDALIPKTTIGCKRKVLDTNYLACLHRDNVELVHDDPVEEIVEHGVRTRSGRRVGADAIVLATGFATHQVLFPMKIIGERGISLNEHWQSTSSGAAQAYLGTCVPSFPNLFILMGPNTVTGHLSVIYTVECQINFALRLTAPILDSLHSRRSLLTLRLPLSSSSSSADSVTVKPTAAAADSAWLQHKLDRLVWASGCSSWALHPETGTNIMMYPDWQFWFWWRSVFVKRADFVFRDAGTGRERSVAVGVGTAVRRWAAVLGVLAVAGIVVSGFVDQGLIAKMGKGVVERAREMGVRW
ncbi:hypothetical protein BJ546DRAFT_426549 [Cryomyces antarcticus]